MHGNFYLHQHIHANDVLRLFFSVSFFLYVALSFWKGGVYIIIVSLNLDVTVVLITHVINILIVKDRTWQRFL